MKRGASLDRMTRRARKVHTKARSLAVTTFIADGQDSHEVGWCECTQARYSPWANPEKSLRKGSLVPRAGTKVSLHKCED